MRTTLAVLAALFLMISAARADAPADSAWTDAEKWAWSRIEAGQSANFDLSCNASTVSPFDDAVWNAPCRSVRGTVLEQMLTRAPWRDAMQHQGLRIVGAHVVGGLDLANAHIVSAVTLARSHIDGDIELSRARLDDMFALDGSIISGAIDATGLVSESDISLADGRQLGTADGPTGSVEVFNTVTLRNARIKGSLYLNVSTFHDTVNVSGAHIEEEMQTGGARFLGGIAGGSMQVGIKLSVNSTQFSKDALFPDSTIGGLVDASRSTFGGKFSLVDSHVTGDVFISGLAGANGIDISGSQIGGYVSFAGSILKGTVKATNTQVAGNVVFDDKGHIGGPIMLTGGRIGGALLMAKSSFGDVVMLRNTHVMGDVLMGGANFKGDLDMLALHADGDVVLAGAAIGGNLVASNIDVKQDFTLADGAHVTGAVNLADAHIVNAIHMEKASFDKGLVVASAQIASDVFLDGSTFGGPVQLDGTHIGGSLVLTGAQLGAVDLTGALIDGSLVVSAATAWHPPVNPAARQLLLINARVGGIQDGAVGQNAECPSEAHPPKGNGWPAARTVEFDGFTYSHLGSSAGTEGTDMRERDVCWWRWWLERDPDFSSQPYVQLAAVMTAHGDQDNAAEVLYYGRVRETLMAWDAGHPFRWGLLTALRYITGYGIGSYTFRALYWIIGLTVIGMVLLALSPGAGRRTWLWRTGASLTRVLPGIEINKEFTDFFNDPRRRRLRGWQVFVFSTFVVMGWVLGLFLVAAMSGLTQHS